MPRCTIDGRPVEVPPGTTVIGAAEMLGIAIPHFCYHPDLPVDGSCRMCLVEIENNPKLQIACNTVVSEGMAIFTSSEKAAQAHRSTLEFLLANHPIDCPVCDQAGECYLQNQYMDHGLHASRIELDEKVRKQKLVDLGPILLDAERCVLCSRCIRFERVVTGTNSFEFVGRGGRTEIATYRNRPITHQYALNLADVCPVGALLSRDFRFKMRVWFLQSTESICPGCSTGCNIHVDHRDGEIYRLRPRRNVDVNRSWLCDPGRALYRLVGAENRLTTARLRQKTGWQDVPTNVALDLLANRLKDAGADSAFIASPQASNEDLFAFRRLAETVGGLLEFRVGDPHTKLRTRIDNVLQRADRNPNTQGCIELGIGRSGLDPVLAACRAGRIKALFLQGPELLVWPPAAEAVRSVDWVAVLATHQIRELDRAHAILPAATWAETDGTFTNFDRRVQRFARAVPPPGQSRPRWELAAGLLRRLGAAIDARSSSDLFALLAQAVPAYRGLDHRAIGSSGRVLPPTEGEPATAAE